MIVQFWHRSYCIPARRVLRLAKRYGAFAKVMGLKDYGMIIVTDLFDDWMLPNL